MSRRSIRSRLIDAAKRYLPAQARRRIVGVQRALHLQWPPAGAVRFGNFRRLTPISPICGYDRGLPIDRYYTEAFLAQHRTDIRGRALEFGGTDYLDQFGDDRVLRKDVFSYVPGPNATLVGDLTGSTVVAPDAFDCIVCTFTLQMVYDIHKAVRNLRAMLKPGGVLLVTTSGIVRTTRHFGQDAWAEYWHLTQQSARSLFEEAFDGTLTVQGYGNVLSAAASLYGLAASELTREELDHADRDYDVIVAIRAVRAPVS